MSWTVSLVSGLAELLAAGGVGAWRPDGAGYQDGETAIVYRAVPQSPDRLITLTPYPVSDDPVLADVVIGIQVRTRGDRDPRTADAMADAVYELLHGATGLDLGGVAVVDVRRQSSALLGADETGRWERTDNYYLSAMRPTAHRP